MVVDNLEELLAPKLGPNKKFKIVDISKPPAKGFGSTMVKVKVKLQDENNKEEILHLVGKKIPSSEEKREIFDIQKTFKKEAAFYEVVVPILDEFQKEEGIEDVLDNFAKFYGVRFSLENNNNIVDDGGVILMEDLSIKGYNNVNHGQGFDLNYAEKILQDLAKFHGTGIALKFKKPVIFNEKIRPLLIPYNFSTREEIKAIFRVFRELIETQPQYRHLAEKATNFTKIKTPTGREPFGTISHSDFWVNNIMNKIEKDGSVRNIFVDFQIYDYRSAASDVFFFLMTSVKFNVLRLHLDHLLTYYHQHLLNTLKEYNLDISLFSYEKFEEEMQIVVPEYEIGHSLLFKFFLGFLPEVDAEVNFTKLRVDDLSSELKEVLLFIVTESAERGWLNKTKLF